MRRMAERTVLADGDQIIVGETRLLFTEKDFDTKESALMHYKKVGERSRATLMDFRDE